MSSLSKEYQVNSKSFKLSNCSTKVNDGFKKKKDAKKALKNNNKDLKKIQEKLYASDKYAVLIIFQAMDAGGKDSTIKHVMSGVNPQGCEVHSFKHPSDLELSHDFIWRHQVALPERGRIGIFNRSHYENVLISKVHPQLVMSERIPNIYSTEDVDKQFWATRYDQINRYEENVANSGTIILKFFLHISKEEQKNRFLERLNNPDKHWKFALSDMEERNYWDDYQTAYETAIQKTSKRHAPWFVIPADNKWNARLIIGQIIYEQLSALNIEMPSVSEEQLKLMEESKKKLEQE